MHQVLTILILTTQLRYPFNAGCLSFPHDEGAHYGDSVVTEWWYNNMLLRTEDGDSFGVMLTFFRRPATARVFNITTLGPGEFLSGVDLLGQMTADTGHLDITYTGLTGTVADTFRWTFSSDSIAFSYVAKANDVNIPASCSLRLRAVEYPFAIDSIGYVRLGDSSQMSFYYSIPFMEVEGVLRLRDSSYAVRGHAWMDRQWGPFTASPEGGYEWFSMVSMRDSTGIALQAWNIFDGDSVPHRPAYHHLNIFYTSPDTTIQVVTSDFSLERLGYVQDPVTGRFFSQGWRLVMADSTDVLVMEFSPYTSNQIVTFVGQRFFEGICHLEVLSWKRNGVQLNPDGAESYAFAELVQKYDAQIEPPSTPEFIEFRYDTADSTLTMTWHPSEPGTYPIGGYRVYVSTDPNRPSELDHIFETRDTSLSMWLPPEERIAVYISAYDSASAVNGSGMAGPFFYIGPSIDEAVTDERAGLLQQHGNRLNIRCAGGWKLTVISPSGRVVEKISGHGNADLSVPSVPDGVYLAILETSAGKTRRKLVILR